MEIIVGISVVILPFIVLFLYRLLGKWRFIIDVVAAVAAMSFAIVSTVAVYQIRRDGTIFMTNIHRLFDNYIFLISGAYLGMYGLCQLIRYSIKKFLYRI
ncbi:hypothetical protein E0485_04340 [Paenibacillus albiflavus]|uniref:Uncharacterized protein n=1 Tax=Paenibacillus albiflavus TaxID=2545760 RepID=A0A4R4EKT3_9BACL|nr:hypothetical protein [Paenibacillus albiflavus]TCZ80093.1 hypothetical protein E0485_04340 [Paenibacillus albiflavus]